MNEETRVFIRTYLYIDGADEDLRGVLDGFSEDYATAVRTGLQNILATREIGLEQYEALTDFEFQSENDLYDYLQKVNQYVFHDSEEQPKLPVY